MANRHTDLIRQYCEIWIDDPEPWKRVQYKDPDGISWLQCKKCPEWHEDFVYRIIPEQITIAGITFDAPLREEPVRDADIFIPSMFHPTGYHCDTWSGYSHQQAGLKAGGCFASPEAAAACARAFSKLVGGEV